MLFFCIVPKEVSHMGINHVYGPSRKLNNGEEINRYAGQTGLKKGHSLPA